MTLYEFYRSSAWRGLLKVLKLERLDKNGNIICEYCGKPVTAAYDCIGHHKIYLTQQSCNDASIALNPDNIALVHHRCHNLIHDKLGRKNREVYLVWGPPLSGKTTYVDTAKSEGDLVIDMDNIWQCITGSNRYDKPPALKQTAFSVRDLLIDEVRTRHGRWSNAYVIGGYPLSSERERLIERLGAREIFLELSQEECLERLKDDGKRNEKWRTYIADWFKKYSGSW